MMGTGNATAHRDPRRTDVPVHAAGPPSRRRHDSATVRDVVIATLSVQGGVLRGVAC